MDKKIAVLGTGANGSCTAANLTDAGYDVFIEEAFEGFYRAQLVPEPAVALLLLAALLPAARLRSRAR